MAIKFDMRWKKGDTAETYPFSIDVNGVPLDLTEWVIKMEVKKSGQKNRIAQTLVVGDGITLIDDFTLVVGGFIVTIDKGSYVYDIEISKPGIVKTYIEGNLIVSQDVTNAI